MEDLIRQIDAFFDDYEKLFNRSLQQEPDVEQTVKAFASCFVEANPAGINCGKNDDEFRKQIPKGYAFYKSIGTRSMSIRSKNISQLDELHCMTKLDWTASYRKKDGKEESIDFSVIYFTQMQKGRPKIFAYITGDEQKVLKEHGLI
jgi:hypothetical protein